MSVLHGSDGDRPSSGDLPRATPATAAASGSAPLERTSTVVKDIVLICLLSLVLFGLAVRYEAFETFMDWAGEYEHLELDEFATIAVVLPLALAAFALRRWRELRRAIRWPTWRSTTR
jgi:hypothetical protein